MFSRPSIILPLVFVISLSPTPVDMFPRTGMATRKAARSALKLLAAYNALARSLSPLGIPGRIDRLLFGVIISQPLFGILFGSQHRAALGAIYLRRPGDDKGL